MKFVVLIFGVIAVCAAHNAEEGSSLFEAASQVLQDLGNKRGGAGGDNPIGDLVQSFIQSDGGRQIGSMLLGSMAGSGGQGAADILSGLGSLLSGAAQGQGQGFGGLDPAVIGHMMDLFKGSDGHEDDNEVDENNNERGGGAAKGLLELLPSILQTLGSGVGHGHHEDDIIPSDHRGHHVHNHKSTMLPAFLDPIYDMWEHFMQSEFGQTLWQKSGLGTLVKTFTDPETGRLQTERLFASLENPQFRRRWIQSLSSVLAEWIKYFADPLTHSRFLLTANLLGNSLLQAQGYSQTFDPARPSDSISLIFNAVIKRHFGVKIKSSTYIKPAVSYFQELLRYGEKRGFSLTALASSDIESRLADTLNGDILEPVLLVWRAYRFAAQAPQCEAYVLCLVNHQDPRGVGTGTMGIRPVVTRLSSFVAAWFLSGSSNTPFMDLYNVAVETKPNCQTKYRVHESCRSFDEEIRATTEYSHNEL